MIEHPALLDPHLTLAVRNLSVAYTAQRGLVRAVRQVSFDVRRGESLAVIGESGSGKTTLGHSLVRLLPAGAHIDGGQIFYQRTTLPQHLDIPHTIDVLKLTPQQLRQFRWQECALVVQAALNAFNPVLRISDHFADTARAHHFIQGRALAIYAAELLRMVHLDPDRVWPAYPHELSGGMRQRVLIALSLLLTPQLLIFDEPTTALDTLTQRTIIDLLNEIRHTRTRAIVVISHDLALAAVIADRVATLYAGTIVEIGDIQTVFTMPAHPYTAGLLQAMPTRAAHREQLTSIGGAPPDLIDLPHGCPFHPRCPLASEQCRRAEPPLEPIGDGVQVACWHWRAARSARVAHTPASPRVIHGFGRGAAHMPQRSTQMEGERGAGMIVPLIELEHVSRTFTAGRQRLTAVNDLSLCFYAGEIVCLVGESGCGKTTLGKLVAGLLPPSSGTIRFLGQNTAQLRGDAYRRYRRAVQFIHQDPYASLNPLHTVYDILAAPLRRHRMTADDRATRARVRELLGWVDLTPPDDLASKYPHQLSGGQRQRVVIARALTVVPSFLICDEAVAMVDMSMRIGLVNTLARLQEQMGLGVLFITHDLALAKYVGWEGSMAVMYLGQLVELAPTSALIAQPHHRYTQALLGAIPEVDPDLNRRQPTQSQENGNVQP